MSHEVCSGPAQSRPAQTGPVRSGRVRAKAGQAGQELCCKYVQRGSQGGGGYPHPTLPHQLPTNQVQFCFGSHPLHNVCTHEMLHVCARSCPRAPLPAPPRASANDRPCLRTPLRTRSHKRAPQPARAPAYVRLCPHTFLRRGGPASEGQQGRTCGAQAVAGALMCRTRYYPRLCALLQAPCPARARSTSVGPYRARPCFSAPQLARAPLPVRTPACAHPCLCAPCLCAPLPVRTPARVPNAPTNILGCPLGEARSATGSNMKQIPQQ